MPPRSPLSTQHSTSSHPAGPSSFPHAESPPQLPPGDHSDHGVDEEEDPDACLICLTSPIEDRSILPQCLHSLFCFQCIVRWSSLKRQCPLCARPMGAYILHAVRSEDDYVRYFLRPDYKDDARPSTPTGASITTTLTASADRVIREERAQRSQRHSITYSSDNGAAADPLAEWDRSVAKRRLVYRHGLYAMHIGANRHSRFKPPPTAVQLDPSSVHARASSSTSALGSTSRRVPSANALFAPLASFIRREVFALPLVPQNDDDGRPRETAAAAAAATLDVDFTATYILSILKTFDVRSDETVKILAEYFSGGTASSPSSSTSQQTYARAWRLAEHFTHEVMTFLRSGAKDCAAFDRRVVYPSLESRAPTRRTAQDATVDAGGDRGRQAIATVLANARGQSVERESSHRQRHQEPAAASLSHINARQRPVAQTDMTPAKRRRSSNSPPPAPVASSIESSADADTPPQAETDTAVDTRLDLGRREELLRRLVLAKRLCGQRTVTESMSQ